MTVELTPEAVAGMCRDLRAPSYWMSGSNQGHDGENDKPRAAADMMEALAADRDEWKQLAIALAEVEADQNALLTAGSAVEKLCEEWAARAEAAEAKLAAVEAERDHVWQSVGIADCASIKAAAENMQAKLDLKAAEAEANRLRAELAEAHEALIWCSGSNDFQEGGIARDGWLKLCAPILRAIAKGDQA